jgi:hypothetical protein
VGAFFIPPFSRPPHGISCSTIPGTVIGAETERMNEQYEKQDEAAKTEYVDDLIKTDIFKQ